MNRQFKKPNFLFEIVILTIIGVILAFVFLEPRISFGSDDRVFEKGVKYNARELVERSNGTITPEAEYLNTKEVGKFEFHYNVKKLVFEKDVVFKYEVVDTTPPVISFKEDKVLKDPKEKYTDEQIKDNISVNEGTYVYETDYDPYISGPYSVNVTAKDEYGNTSVASFAVEVRDIEAPIVFKDGDGAWIYTNSEVNISELIGYGDNVDPAPKLVTTGEIDTSKPGFYTINASLTDFSGNETAWDFTVEVADSFPENEPSDYFYPFEEFLKDYSGYVMYGIDVSTWQGDIDFEKVKKAGCEFVIIRIGFSYDGKFTLDNRFEQNLERAREAGLKIGIYHFSYDNNEADLLDAINNIFTYLDGVKLDLPVIFDWEDFTCFNDYGMSFRDLNRLYDFFAKEVQKRGYESMLYGSQYYLDRVWAHTDSRPIWLAQYNDHPTYEGQFEIWQLSDSGRIDGIDGNVDLNLLYLRQ